MLYYLTINETIDYLRTRIHELYSSIYRFETFDF